MNIVKMPSVVRGSKFKKSPTLLVIHQAIRLEGVAEYLLSKEAITRSVSCHFAYSRICKNFVQMVPTDTIAYHAGKSQYQGIGKCNNYSIGIELPGPIKEPVSDEVLSKLYKLITDLKKECPSLTHICGHRHIAIPPGRRSDPNKDFPFYDIASTTGLNFHI